MSRVRAEMPADCTYASTRRGHLNNSCTNACLCDEPLLQHLAYTRRIDTVSVGGGPYTKALVASGHNYLMTVREKKGTSRDVSRAQLIGGDNERDPYQYQ